MCAYIGMRTQPIYMPRIQVAYAHIHTLRTLNKKHIIQRDENTTEKGNLTTYHALNINTKINLS